MASRSTPTTPLTEDLDGGLLRSARRHPWLASATLMIVVGMAVVVTEQRRDIRALKRETTALRQASGALADLLSSTDGNRWRGTETLAETAAGTIDELTLRVDVAVPHFSRGDRGLEGALWSLVGRYHGHFPSRREQALAAYRRGLELQAEAYGAADPRALSAMIDLAGFLDSHGQLDGAQALMADYEQLAAGVFAPHDERHLAALLIMGRTAALQGALRPASTLLTRVARGARAQWGDDHELVVAAAGLLTRHCKQLEQLELSLDGLSRRLWSGSLDESSLQALMGLTGHLLSRRRQDDTTRALELRLSALRTWNDRFGTDNETGVLAWSVFASQVPVNRKLSREAECILRRGLAWFEAHAGGSARETLLARQQLAEHLAAAARYDEPRRQHERLRRIDTDRRAEAEALERSVLADLPRPPERALDLHTAATLNLGQLLLERGDDREAEARLLALDALRDRLLDHAREAPEPLATLLARIYIKRSQPERAAAMAPGPGPVPQQP